MLKLVHHSTSGHLPTSTFRLIDGEQEIGFIQIRHRPSHGEGVPPEAATHIYYEIRPEFRCRGYGKHILALGLKEAEILGLREVFVGCFVSNPASRRIIETNGGEFVGEHPTDVGPSRKYRFVIATGPQKPA
jgi:predicted acetyltransferase